MKHLLVTIIAVICFSQGFSQDLLYTKNRGLLKVKVTEVSDAFIKYKSADLPDDVTYTTTKRNVDSIIFENGLIERFSIRSRHHRPGVPSRPERVKNHGIDAALATAPTNQVSAGIWAFGNSIIDDPMSVELPGKNQYAAAVFLRYKTEFLRKRVGLNFTPFFALNKSAYGGAVGAVFNIKRFGKFTIGVGPEYILSVQDIVEKFHHSSGDEYFDYYKKYRSTVSMVTFNTNMNLFLKPNLSIAADVGVGGVVGSNKRKENMISPKDGYYKRGTVGSFKLGVGYWF